MRVFLPAFSDELSAQQPVARRCWAALIPPGTHPEQAEVYEDDAVTEAALAGLELLRDEEPPAGVVRVRRRLVLAADISEEDLEILRCEPADEDGIVFPAHMSTLHWGDVAAIMVDDADAEDAVQAVLDASDQESADQAISDLWDFSIGWFDIAERESLAKTLS